MTGKTIGVMNLPTDSTPPRALLVTSLRHGVFAFNPLTIGLWSSKRSDGTTAFTFTRKTKTALDVVVERRTGSVFGHRRTSFVSGKKYQACSYDNNRLNRDRVFLPRYTRPTPFEDVVLSRCDNPTRDRRRPDHCSAESTHPPAG